jgi:hypothetical protein
MVTSTFVDDDGRTLLTIRQEVFLSQRVGPMRRQKLRRNAETRLETALDRIKAVAESTQR